MAVVNLIGVLEDGTRLVPGVPENPRAALQITQDSATIVRVSITNPAGVPVDSTGTLTLTVKKRPQDIPALLQVAGTWATTLGQGIAEFGFATTALRHVEWGRYCYDVRLAVGGDSNLVIPTSPLLLQPAVSATS